MQLRTLVPTLALSTVAVGGVHAADLGNGIAIGGFVDAILTITDEDAVDDTQIDFSGDAVLQFMSEVSEDVSLQVDLQLFGEPGDEVAVRQAFSTWEVNENFTLQFGKSISWIGYQAAYAPGLWRIGVTPYTSAFYGNDTVGVWGTFSASENVEITVAVIDDIYGTKTEVDSFALGAQAVIGIEGYGSVELELQYDQSGADFYDMSAAADDPAMTLVAHTTADQLVEGWTFGGELIYGDYDVATTMAAMAMANYAFHEKASGTLMVSYYEPNDEADDDEIMEVAAAVLTNPTGDSNFAVNFEVAFVSSDANDAVVLAVEALAIIP